MLDLLIQIQENRQIVKNSDHKSKNGEAFNYMKKIKKEFDKEKKNHIVLKEKLDDIKKNIKIVDDKIENVKMEIKEEENKLYSNFKYDLKLINSLEKSIEIKKMEIKKMEDRSLELLYEEDEVLKEKDKSKNILIELRDNFYKYKETYNDEILKGRKRVKEAEKNIVDLEKMVPKELLDRFYEISEVKGTGAAQLDRGICQGCRMKVSAITLDDINKNRKIVYCDNCGRIIHCNYRNKIKLKK